MTSMKSLTLMLLSLYFLLLIPNSTPLPNYLISICSNNTLPANGLYKTNLDTVLNSLSTQVSKTRSGFGVTASGNGTKDGVYGFYLCRGDQNATSCADCVTAATTTDLRKTYCPSSKVAVIWYDECTVQYSNESLFGKMETDPFELFINAKSYNGNITLFKDVMLETMNYLVAPTANNQSGIKFTTKMVNFTKSDTLYAMEQCAPDLSTGDCTKCLTTAINRLQIKKGARILQPTCHVRYETYPFYIGAVNYTASTPTIAIMPHGKKKVSAKVIIAIVVPVVVAILVILALGICLFKKKAKKYAAVPFGSGSEDLTSADSLHYDLATLQSATNNFSDDNKVGEGGFGIVYKGTLPDGQVVAIKRLSKYSGQGVQEFKNEVMVVAKLQHRNLVRLLGFCLAGDEKLLVYEFVQKSLDYFLFDPKKQDHLDWAKRYNIIEGIAKGMLYLHQDSRLRIIHRDLKASNVLLDGHRNPKISDFGMAKIFGVDQTHGNTSRVVGTYGYMSPEYAMHGQFSVKSDVYSFGVLVLEILSGKKNSSFYESGYADDLLGYAWKQWNEGTPLEFIDETIRDSCPINEVKKCMHLGLLCVQESIDDRPTMATAVLMLDSQSISLPMPEQPAYFSKSITTGSKNEKDIGSDQSTSVPWSMNEVSVSELEPR